MPQIWIPSADPKKEHFKFAAPPAYFASTLEVSPEAPKIEVEFLIEKKVSLVDLVHSHQHFDGSFGESMTAMAVTSSGSVSTFVPRFSLAGLTPPRPVVPLGVGGYLEKLRF